MDYWVVPGLRRQREEVEQTQLNTEQRAKLWQLDRRLVNAVTDLDDPEVPDELLTDDFAQPLSHWVAPGKLCAVYTAGRIAG
jgi:hypothetical protein